jgi:RNA polymerase sigma-70 factor (ECF subfamily)
VPTFDEIFARTRDQVFALALRITGSRAEAEDATQETFLEVHRSLKQFRGESQPSTWVFRIALSASLRARARRNRARPFEAAPELVDRYDNAMSARVDAVRVQAAMEKLSADHRAVLALFALEGLGHKEIAQVLGVPEGTVWSRLHLARKALRDSLEPEARRAER